MYRSFITLFILTIGLALGKDFQVGNTKIWLPDRIEKPGIQGIFVHRTYHAGKQLFAKKEWREFAQRMQFAQALIPGIGKARTGPPVSQALGTSDLARLDAALAEVSKKTGHKELIGLPFITMGVSRGGVNSIMMANMAPDRAIAAVAHHGESIIGIHRLASLSKTLPVLYTMASKDRKRNAKIEDYVRKLMRGKLDLPWTLHLHKDFAHNSNGDDASTFKWLEIVIKGRGPVRNEKGRRVLPAILDKKTLRGRFTLIDSSTSKAKFKDCRIVPITEHHPTDVWLPNKTYATYWLKANSR